MTSSISDQTDANETKRTHTHNIKRHERQYSEHFELAFYIKAHVLA